MEHWKTWKSVVPQAAASTQKQTCTGTLRLHCTKVFPHFLRFCITVPAPREILIKQKSFEVFIIKNSKPIELIIFTKMYLIQGSNYC